MTRILKRSRMIISLVVGSLVLGGLYADKPRYPELDDPFGPRHGPPPVMAQHDSPPPPPMGGKDVDASELIDNLGDSSSAYNDPQAQVDLKQLQALERFLNTPPEQLARIRETIERVEAMSEEEKQALREKIGAFRQLEEDKIRKLRDIHQVWQGAPRDERQLVHRYMMSLPREEANGIREKIAEMPETEFQSYFESLLAKAKEADAAGQLPTMPESIRRWKRDRKDSNGGPDRGPEDRVNARKPDRE